MKSEGHRRKRGEERKSASGNLRQEGDNSQKAAQEHKLERRLRLARRRQAEYPYWRQAVFDGVHRVWVNCNAFGAMPRSRLLMRYDGSCREYTPNKRHVTACADSEPHKLEGGKFVRIGTVDYVAVYTDGSFDMESGRAGVGVYIRYPDRVERWGRPVEADSVADAEFFAALWGLSLVEKGVESVRLVVDCSRVAQLARIRSPSGHNLRGRALQKALQRFTNFDVHKVKGHSGVPGNEIADRLARQAMRESVSISETA